MPDILSKDKVTELAVPAVVLIEDTKGSEYTISN
jgi:hypothetical protein